MSREEERDSQSRQDLERLREALAKLRARIVDRDRAALGHREFAPLVELADDCARLAAGAGGVGIGARRPVQWLRPFCFVATLVAGAVGVVLAVVTIVFAISIVTEQGDQTAEKLPALQAGVGLLIILGGAVISLWAHERRIRRRKLVGALHRIRALAHRADLLQLTHPTKHYVVDGPATEASPELKMSDFEFSRYLIYCRSLLSWLGKIAALHAARVSDPVVLSAVDDVEALSSRLQTTIGQRLLLLRSILRDAPPV